MPTIEQPSSLKEVIDFNLAFTAPRIVYGKEPYMIFYAFNPSIKRMQRKRIRLKMIGNNNQIHARETELVAKFTRLLLEGWKPWRESAAILTRLETKQTEIVTISQAIAKYEKHIESEVRRSVMSAASQQTYAAYIRRLKKWIAKNKLKYITDIDAAAISRMLTEMEDTNVSTKYWNSYSGFLKTIFTWFVSQGMIEKSPADGIKKKTMARIAGRETLTDDERNELFKRLRQCGKINYLAACMIEYYCYIRPNELYRVKIENIDFDEQTIFIPAAISKNRKDGKVTMPSCVSDVLIEIGVKEKAGSCYLFGYGMQPSTKIGSQKMFGRYWDRHIVCDGGVMPELKQRDITFYSLKNSGITDMLNNDVPSIVVRDQARHQDISTTEIYARKKNMKAPTTLKDYQPKRNPT